MIHTTRSDFRFSRDWVHAGVRYDDGDKASLPDAEAAKLERLGAGKVIDPAPHEQRKPKRP